MRFLLHLTVAALLVAIGMGGMTSATAAERDARAAVLGRQKIREELSAALAKGYLTRMDQYHILLHAKEVLSEDDLHGLEQTLNRLATQQAMARASAAAQRAAPVQPRTRDSEPEITPSKYEETKAGEAPVAGERQPTRANAASETPFVEEVPASIGKPTMNLDSEDPEACGCDSEDPLPRFRWIDIDLLSSVDAFKGPMDLGNANGNFGLGFGVNAAVPILPRLGIGLQAGTSTVLSNLKGSPYPEPNATIRYQTFATVGMFQRLNRENGAFTWGFVYDWLFDDYYSDFQFGQWRVKGAWEINPCNEIGISAAVPDRGSSGMIPNFLGGFDVVSFRPITQGYLYWRHTWENNASLTGRLGVAERPGEFLFGAESRVPLTRHLALTGDFSYIMPNAAGGAIGQTQEIWNVSVGMELVLGGFGRCGATRFQPFMPVADNGSLAVRETGQ
jgi:hypothetical protein